MWADDDDFGLRDGVLVLSKNPSLRVEQNRLVIRDGYRPDAGKPYELRLARAETARSALRHIIMLGEAGWVSNAAHQWLRDTGVALSLIEPNGNVVFATGPRGPDRPWLRRLQAAIGLGLAPGAVGIARELLRAKIAGQAAVLRLIGRPGDGEWVSEDEVAAFAIEQSAENIAGEADGAKVLSEEARAGRLYWRSWEEIPVSFARIRPGGFDRKGRWSESLPVPDHWTRFGQRASLLTAKPWRATDPANCCLNFAYGLLKAEMTIALVARSLDPGLGLFHADEDGRPSLTLDAMEPVRPLADAFVASFLSQSSFLLRDFAQTSDGELRLSHPLRQHLGRCAALFRRPCEQIAEWLAHAFEAAGRTERVDGVGAGDLALVMRVSFAAEPPRLPALPSADKLGMGFLAPRQGYVRIPTMSAGHSD